MSNLIKAVYFNVDNQNAHVIDSDVHVEDFIPQIYEQEKTSENDSDGDLKEEFSDGISVISMEDVRSEERKKLDLELKQKQEEVLSEAKKQAEEILAAAHKQELVIYDQARAEGEKLGVEQGQVRAAAELDRQKKELQAEFDARALELQKKEEELEPVFADLVVSLVKKLTGVVCENKRDVVIHLIQSAIENAEKTKHLNIRVSKPDMARVSAKKSEFKALTKDTEDLDITEDDSLAKNQCIIETDNKIIDCSLDAQLENLEEHVKMLLY